MDYNESDLHNCPQVSYGTSSMGRLWKELQLQGLARRRDMQRAQRIEVTKNNKQTRELQFLFASTKICALALYVCPSNWQLKCTLSQLLRIHMTFYETVMLIIMMWSRGCCLCCLPLLLLLTMKSSGTFSDQTCSLLHSYHPPFFCLFSLPVCSASFRTNWCCLCANLLSRNTP